MTRPYRKQSDSSTASSSLVSMKIVQLGRLSINKFARRSKRRNIIIAIVIGQLFALCFYLMSDRSFPLPDVMLDNQLANVMAASSKDEPSSALKSSGNKIEQPVVTIEDESSKPCTRDEPLPTEKYVIISATTPPDDAARCALGNAECSYAFYLPITAMAWSRFSYKPVVMIAGDDSPWLRGDGHLNVIYRALIEKANATIIFLPVQDDLKIIFALVSRIFAPDFAPFAHKPDAYMVTSDADLIPIQDIYSLQQPKEDVKIANARCCGSFSRGEDKQITMMSMAGIGMRVRTWHSVMKYRELSNKANSVERIMEAITKEFGKVPRDVRRGDEPGWFLDQEFISYKIYKWRRATEKKCAETTKGQYPTPSRYSEHTGAIKRLDSGSWPAFKAAHEWQSFTDANCPIPGHAFDSFKYFLPFIETILTSDKFDVLTYWHTFAKRVYGDSLMTIEKAKETISKLPHHNYESVNLYHPNMNGGERRARRVDALSEGDNHGSPLQQQPLMMIIILITSALLMI